MPQEFPPEVLNYLQRRSAVLRDPPRVNDMTPRQYHQRQARDIGLNTLLQILRRQGATDPAMLNRDIQAITRGTEANVGALEEAAAARGLGGSGVAQALMAATREGGAERISQRRAEETALTEERKRRDLQLILDLVIGPRLTRRGQNIQRAIARMSGGGGGGGDLLGGIGSILGGVGGIMGGMGGGKPAPVQ